jgi:transposase-like protein
MTRRRVLTKAQAAAIRAEYQPRKVSYAVLARKYGVGESTIRDVIKHYQRGYL